MTMSGTRQLQLQHGSSQSSWCGHLVQHTIFQIAGMEGIYIPLDPEMEVDGRYPADM
jgi:hypothetical protein